MGIGKAFKKAVKQVSNTVTDAGADAVKGVKTGFNSYTESKLGSMATPYLSLYTADGRDAVVKSWGGWAQAGAGAVNPTLGAAVSAGVGAYNNYNAPDASSGPAFMPVAPQGAAAPTTKDRTLWYIGGGVGILALVLILTLSRGRK